MPPRAVLGPRAAHLPRGSPPSTPSPPLPRLPTQRSSLPLTVRRVCALSSFIALAACLVWAVKKALNDGAPRMPDADGYVTF